MLKCRACNKPVTRREKIIGNDLVQCTCGHTQQFYKDKPGHMYSAEEVSADLKAKKYTLAMMGDHQYMGEVHQNGRIGLLPNGKQVFWLLKSKNTKVERTFGNSFVEAKQRYADRHKIGIDFVKVQKI